MQPEQLPAGVTMAELLQLAMNSSSHAVAEAAAYYVPAQLEPAVVRGLLVTAATRQHVSAVHIMTLLEVVKQHADAPTLHRALQELIAPHSVHFLWQSVRVSLWEYMAQASNLRSNDQRVLCIMAVCALPAAAQLGSDVVMQLLLVALQAQADDQCICSLRRVTAAAQINSIQLTEILQAAVQLRRVECTRMLCSLPAAEEMSSEQVAAVLLTALQQDSTACAHAILKQFPSVVHLKADMLAPLLLAAAGHRNTTCMERLCSLPGRDGIGPAAVVSLLQAAVQAGTYVGFELLTQIPAMANITSGDVLQLLRAAFQAPL
jgi:hypothetical protein